MVLGFYRILGNHHHYWHRAGPVLCRWEVEASTWENLCNGKKSIVHIIPNTWQSSPCNSTSRWNLRNVQLPNNIYWIYCLCEVSSNTSICHSYIHLGNGCGLSKKNLLLDWGPNVKNRLPNPLGFHVGSKKGHKTLEACPKNINTYRTIKKKIRIRKESWEISHFPLSSLILRAPKKGVACALPTPVESDNNLSAAATAICETWPSALDSGGGNMFSIVVRKHPKLIKIANDSASFSSVSLTV